MSAGDGDPGCEDLEIRESEISPIVEPALGCVRVKDEKSSVDQDSVLVRQDGRSSSRRPRLRRDSLAKEGIFPRREVPVESLVQMARSEFEDLFRDAHACREGRVVGVAKDAIEELGDGDFGCGRGIGKALERLAWGSELCRAVRSDQVLRMVGLMACWRYSGRLMVCGEKVKWGDDGMRPSAGWSYESNG